MKSVLRIKIARGFSLFQEILLCCLIGLFIAVVLLFSVWMFFGVTRSTKEYTISFLVTFFAFSILSGAIKMMKNLVFTRKFANVVCVCEQDGYTDKFFYLFESLIEREKNYKNKLRLNVEYARYLCEGEHYKKAVEVINQMLPVCADVRCYCNLFGIGLYSLVCGDDMENADKLKESSMVFFDKYSKKDCGSMLNIALGLYECKKDNLANALRYFESAYLQSKNNSWERTQSQLLMCYVYCKQGLDKGEDGIISDLLYTLEEEPMTYRQEQDYTKLLNYK